METSAPVHRPWHPLTFSSVAALAQTPLSRWWWLAMTVALLGAASLLWFMAIGWRPVVVESIQRLPEQCWIRRGFLEWNERSPFVLGHNSFLGLTVDVDELTLSSTPADVQCDLGKTQFKVRSILGYLSLPYPKQWLLLLDRTQAESWWGAWEPFVWIVLGVGATSLWFLVWTVCATLYAFPLHLLIFFLDRHGNWLTGWRLALAAQLPGALFLAAAVVGYGLHYVDLATLLFVFAAHVLMSWIFLLCSLGWLPRLSTHHSWRKNPFRAPPEHREKE